MSSYYSFVYSLTGALGTEEIAGLLNLGEIQDRHWAIFGTNSQKGKSIKEVFKEVVRLIKLTRKEKMERKSELLKKHNNKLKESSKDTEIEETTKVPPLDLDLSDDSIKKPSLFDSINKSKTSSEDGNENKSEKSDQYDTVFTGKANIVTPDGVETVSYDNKAYDLDEDNRNYESYDQNKNAYEANNEHESAVLVSNEPTEELNTSETNMNTAELDVNDTYANKRDVDKNSVTDVKVTDLDSDSDESTQDNHVKEQSEASVNY